MMASKLLVHGVMALVLSNAAFAQSADQEAVLNALDDYTAFVPYDGGIIAPAQITEDILDGLIFIDTRRAEEFDAATIQGARHIEWRDVFARVDDIPTDKKVVLFCNTGALSAQAAFGLRVLGYDNVLILQSGYEGWVRHKSASDS